VVGVRVVVIRCSSVVKGHVTIQGSRPEGTSGVLVFLKPMNGNAYFPPIRIDAQGNFQFENVAPGDYEIQAVVTSGGSFDRSSMAKQQRVTVEDGATVEVNFVLDTKPK